MKLGTDGWQFGPSLNDHRQISVCIRHEKFWWSIDKATRKAMKSSPWHGRVVSMERTCIAVMVLSFWFIRIIFIQYGYTTLLAEVASFVFALGIAQIVSVFRYKPMLEWLASRRLSFYQCGSCLYQLDGINPDPDGCTLCPECGAAWKLPPREPPATTH